MHRVFAQSLSDTFEDYRGGKVVRADGSIDASLMVLRTRYLAVIEGCTYLTFQLLTKRPENVREMVPQRWLDRWPAHVQIGTSVGDQESAEKRIPHLLRVPAAVRFLSVEPQLGPVDLRRWLCRHRWQIAPGGSECLDCTIFAPDGTSLLMDAREPRIAWVIQGGESGDKARPFELDWTYDLQAQCKSAGVAYFRKQLGAVPTMDEAAWRAMPGMPLLNGSPAARARVPDGKVALKLVDSHGGDESEWFENLRGARAFPSPA